MKALKINNTDKFAIVDEDVYERVCLFNWNLNNDDSSIYRTDFVGGKSRYCRIIALSQEVCKDYTGLYDHIDRDIYNNCRSNLRLATISQNNANRAKYSGAYTSKFKGVTLSSARKKWKAYIRVDKKLRHLGYFESEIDAAIAYNKAAIKYFKEFACINPV